MEIKNYNRHYMMLNLIKNSDASIIHLLEYESFISNSSLVLFSCIENDNKEKHIWYAFKKAVRFGYKLSEYDFSNSFIFDVEKFNSIQSSQFYDKGYYDCFNIRILEGMKVVIGDEEDAKEMTIIKNDNELLALYNYADDKYSVNPLPKNAQNMCVTEIPIKYLCNEITTIW